MVLYTPWLWLIAILKGFFLLAYNLEWFGGWFHTDAWFAFAWGVLPVLAGYVLQTNQLSLAVLLMAAAMGMLSLVEIKSSRPYKALKRIGRAVEPQRVLTIEVILKGVSLGTMLLAVGLLVWRWFRELEALFAPKTPDLLVLNDATSPVARFEIFRDGICLYQAAPGIFDREQDRAFFLYADTRWLRQDEGTVDRNA